jgi:hypothetical protein
MADAIITTQHEVPDGRTIYANTVTWSSNTAIVSANSHTVTLTQPTLLVFVVTFARTYEVSSKSIYQESTYSMAFTGDTTLLNSITVTIESGTVTFAAKYGYHVHNIIGYYLCY